MTIPNQAPDSSVAGFLQPVPLAPPPPNPPPIEGQSLENYIQQFIAGVAGLDGTLVRPRFQVEPPNIPPFDTPCWAAAGITRHRPIGSYGAIIHNPGSGPLGLWFSLDQAAAGFDQGQWQNPSGNAHDLMQRHEEIDLLVSFYGPECDTFAGNLHDGLMIWQNRSVLRLAGIALVEVSDGVRLAELVKEQFLDRYDKVVTLRRIVQRVYPVLNIVDAKGWVQPEPQGIYQAPFDTSSLPRAVPALP